MLAACGAEQPPAVPAPPATGPETGPATPAAPREEVVRAVFLGDSYTVGVGAGVGDGYVDRVAEGLGWDAVQAGQSGTGYVSEGRGGDRTPYGERVDDVAAAAPDVVVVQGSTNDVGVPAAEVGAAAADLYADLAAAVPGADIVVVGPLAPPDVPLSEIEAISDALATAAAHHGLLYVDPLGEAWLTPPDGLYADGLHPDAEGYAVFADELLDQLEAAGF